jgi:hypothetical protein
MLRNDTSFYFQLPASLLAQAREMAEHNGISTSAFIREAIARNLLPHKVGELHKAAVETRTATQPHKIYTRFQNTPPPQNIGHRT